MNRQLIIWIILCLAGSNHVKAQWTPQDSLWLNRILSGKDTLRLNQETKDAILKGNLLEFDRPHNSPLLQSTPELPLIKDFNEYILSRDSIISRIKWTDLPPELFIRFYNPIMPKAKYELSENFKETLERELRGYVTTPGYDFVHALNMVFSPEYRRWIHNQKNAQKLQYYNDLPSGQLHGKIKKYQADHTKKYSTPDIGTKKELPLPNTRSGIRKDSLSTNQSSFGPDSLFRAMPADSSGYKNLPTEVLPPAV